MMTTSCLLLKPQVATPTGREKQRSDIENFIGQAIKQAGLSFIGSQDGLEVSDISDDLIQKIYETDVLVIDANCYETGGIFKFSPYLYYYMALGHSRGNMTILVAEDTVQLPHNLIKYHTLTYSLTNIWKFIDRFKTAVEEIEQGKNEDNPDNPVQSYLYQDALIKARRQIAELKAERSQQKQGKPSITFRRVE